MTSQSLWRRGILVTGLLIALVASLVVVGNIPQPSFAQEGTAVAYGEVVEGNLDASGSAMYSFEAEEGDMVQITVLGFDFAPNVELLDTDANSILSDDMSTNDQKAVTLHSAALSGGEHHIVVTGDASAGGRFAVSLEQVNLNLPEGTLIESGQTVSAEVMVPLVYNFMGAAEDTLVLTVRSLTDGYRPTLVLMNGDGETLASVVAPHFLSTIYVIEPGEQEYWLVVQRGEFSDTANIEVSLSGGATDTTETTMTPPAESTTEPTVDMTTTVEPTLDPTLGTPVPTIDMTATVDMTATATIDLTLNPNPKTVTMTAK